MVDKIKGARLNTDAVREFDELIAQNINTVENKINEIIDAIREKGIL